jgi:hypothetical protein
MRSLTKSPLAFVRVALEAGQAALPPYSCSKSPHKYTQAQLFAILALKEFMQLDYRGIIAQLADWAEARETIGLKQLPNFSTLKYAQDRLLEKGASQRCWKALSISLASTD